VIPHRRLLPDHRRSDLRFAVLLVDEREIGLEVEVDLDDFAREGGQRLVLVRDR
jgi:hypothetical protein